MLYVPHGKEKACYLSTAFCSPLISSIHESLHFPGSRCLLEPPSLLAKGRADRSHLGQQRERQPPPGELQSCFLSLVFKHSIPKGKDLPLAWRGTLSISCDTSCCRSSAAPQLLRGAGRSCCSSSPCPGVFSSFLI